MSEIDLSKKFALFRRITRAGRWPAALVTQGYAKIRAGHKQHGDAATLDPVQEAIQEVIDLGGGYPAIAMAQGKWHWGWWVVVILSGICGRILLWMGREQRGE